MLCAISGEAPQEPVVSKKTGTVYEKRLIEKYIEENGKEPGTDEELDLDDLLAVKTARIVRPRPPTLTSIPALLSTFQNEWDSLALEAYNLQEQLARTREELATALYQHDAAVRVITRLTKERDEARLALSKVTVSAGSASNGDAMAVDSEALPEELVDVVNDTHQRSVPISPALCCPVFADLRRLSKARKKRPVPKGWVKADAVASFEKLATETVPVTKVTSVGVEGDYAAVGGFEGDVAIVAIESAKLERSFKVDEPITDTLWLGTRIIVATGKGSVKVYDAGSEVASFSDHAGPATGLALHPSEDILAAVGVDKSIVLYQLSTLKRVARVFADSCMLLALCSPGRKVANAHDSPHDVCFPPRRPPLGRRHRIRRHQGLHDDVGRASHDFQPGRAGAGHRLLGEWVLDSSHGEGADDGHHLRPAQGGGCGHGQGARHGQRRAVAGVGLLGPVPRHRRDGGRHGATVRQGLQILGPARLGRHTGRQRPLGTAGEEAPGGGSGGGCIDTGSGRVKPRRRGNEGWGGQVENVREFGAGRRRPPTLPLPA